MTTQIDEALQEIEAASGGINAVLLSEVADYIGNHPKEFDMEVWGEKRGTGDSKIVRLVNRLRGSCHTVGCLAYYVTRFSGQECVNPPVQAQEILGLSYERAESLFYVGSWPEPYVSDYLNDQTREGRAWITCERIRHFIATGE